MEITKLAMVLLASIMSSSMWVMSRAQSSGCNNVLMTLSPCLDYIQGKSSSPSSSCCTQLADVAETQPQCLCQVLNGGSSNVNKTQAASLPGACKVQNVHAGQCSGNNGGATTSPSSSPATPSSATPSSNSDGESKENAATPPSQNNAGNMSNSPIHIILALFFILSRALIGFQGHLFCI